MFAVASSVKAKKEKCSDVKEGDTSATPTIETSRGFRRAMRRRSVPSRGRNVAKAIRAPIFHKTSFQGTQQGK